MSRKLCRIVPFAGRQLIALSLACAGSLSAIANAAPEPQDVRSITERANLALGLLASEYVQIEQPLEAGVPFMIQFDVDGRACTLDLEVHSVRGADYQLFASGPNGVLTPVEPGPVNTLTGVILEEPGSRVSASVTDEGLTALMVMGDGTRQWLQPIVGQVPEAPFGSHVVYRDEDMLESEGSCGVDDRMIPREFGRFAPDGETEGDGGGAITGGTLYTAELACDADFPYYQDYGSNIQNVENRINQIINLVNNHYESQVGIVHVITAIIVRTSAVYSTNSAGGLLDQFRARWLQNHGNIQRDVAHLFTGRNLSGGTIGIAATIGGICTSFAYCLSESDCCGSTGCATDLTAHELGHLWGGFHCDPCNSTMRSFIGCFNNFIQATRNSIIGHRNSAACLDIDIFDWCSASSTSTQEEFISNFALGTINHNSPSTGYTDYSTQFMTDLEMGESHTVSVLMENTDGGELGGLWIDWNNDFIFNNLDEKIPTDWSGAGPYTATIIVPSNASLGAKRLRVRVQDSTSNPFLSACGNTSTGEVHDYTVVVIDDVPPPANDDCATAVVISEGSHPLSNSNATTDGPEHEFSCVVDGYTQIGSDVWYRYDPPCLGLVTLSLCDADFNTKIAVYENVCPDEFSVVYECNDDSCGTGSSLLFVAVPGTSYYIRVGGFEGVQGTATLELSNSCVGTTGACCFGDGTCSEVSLGDCTTAGGTYSGNGTGCSPNDCPQPPATGACCFDDGTCSVLTDDDCTTGGGVYSGDDTSCSPNDCPQPPDCPADLDGNLIVDFQDLLLVLASWGTNGTGADIAEPLDLVDFQDLLGLLASWGPCD